MGNLSLNTRAETAISYMLIWLSASLCLVNLACYEEEDRLRGVCFDAEKLTINYFSGDPIDHVEFYRDGDSNRIYIISKRPDRNLADSGIVFLTPAFGDYLYTYDRFSLRANAVYRFNMQTADLNRYFFDIEIDQEGDVMVSSTIDFCEDY